MIITDKSLLSVAIPEDKLTASVFAFDEGAGEGSAGDKFRVSGTREMVEGARANKVSGVLVRGSLFGNGAPLKTVAYQR